MNIRNAFTSALLCVGLVACAGDDDGESETTVSMPSTTSGSTGSTSSASAEGSTAAEPTTGAVETSEGMTSTGMAESTGGSGEEVCATCDPETEFCFESIADAPSIFSCRPVPKDCADDVTCACIQDLACPESLQACQDQVPIIVECVEG